MVIGRRICGWMAVPIGAAFKWMKPRFPILLVDLARRDNALGKDDLTRLWPMVRKAASFLVCNGPVTQQDRWEEDPGYSPFTLAAEIAALLVAAELADLNKEPAARIISSGNC